MKKVLITGAGGQLGGCFARYLDQKGIEVEAAGRQGLDIRDFSAVSKAVGEGGFDAVINCAAFNDVDGAESAVHEAIDVNSLGPRNLAIACEREGAVLMHFSTDYVFGGGRNTPFTIADIPNPLGAYARSKLLGERLVREQCRSSYVVRVSWVFAPGGRNNFVSKMLAWAAGKRRLRVVTDQVSRPSYAPDLVPVLWQLLQSGQYGLYHLANSGFCSRYDWARQIASEAGLNVELDAAKSSDFDSPASRPDYSVLDLHPLEGMYGPLPDWRDATSRCLKAMGRAA